MHSVFLFNNYVLKRQVFSLTGTFQVFSETGQQMLYARQKMFKIREDLRVYSDETQSLELLHIQARQFMDFSTAYDIFDSTTSEKVGVLRRRGLRSIARDEWEILDAGDSLIGKMQEDSAQRAILRRMLLGSLLPQRYDVFFQNELKAEFDQKFNLLRYELMLDFSKDPNRTFDRRLGISAAILLAAIEGRQE